MDTQRMPSWIVRSAWTLFAVMVFALILGPVVAFAAPRAKSAGECERYTIIASAVRTLASLRVDKQIASAFVTEVFVLPDEDAKTVVHLVIDAAYADVRSSTVFAQALYGVCMEHQGDMDSILGVGI